MSSVSEVVFATLDMMTFVSLYAACCNNYPSFISLHLVYLGVYCKIYNFEPEANELAPAGRPRLPGSSTPNETKVPTLRVVCEGWGTTIFISD